MVLGIIPATLSSWLKIVSAKEVGYVDIPCICVAQVYSHEDYTGGGGGFSPTYSESTLRREQESG